MRIFIAIGLLIFMQGHINAQSLNKKIIDNWMVKSDSSFKTQTRVLYVFNGMPFSVDDSVKLDDQLKPFDIKDCWIDYLGKNDLMKSDLILCIPPNDIILIGTKRQASRKSKRKTLELVRSKFLNSGKSIDQDDNNSGAPIIMVDDKAVQPTAVLSVLNNLKLNNLYDIVFMQHPLLIGHDNSAAKNGLVKIWTVAAEKSSQKVIHN